MGAINIFSYAGVSILTQKSRDMLSTVCDSSVKGSAQFLLVHLYKGFCSLSSLITVSQRLEVVYRFHLSLCTMPFMQNKKETIFLCRHWAK